MLLDERKNMHQSLQTEHSNGPETTVKPTKQLKNRLQQPFFDDTTLRLMFSLHRLHRSSLLETLLVPVDSLRS